MCEEPLGGGILLKNACIATLDHRSTYYDDGAILVEDGVITKVGRSDDVTKGVGSVDVTVDGRGCLVLPGLIDCHIHLAQALLRSLVPDDVNLIQWLKDWVWPLQGSFQVGDGRVSSELCILEMLKSGTTCFLESMLHSRYGLEGIAQVVLKSGIRGVLSKTVMDLPGYADQPVILPEGMIESREQAIKDFQALHRGWAGKGNGRIDVWIGPRTPGACTEDLYKEVASLAAETGAGITMHLAEVREDVEYFSRLRTTPSAFVEKLGMLGERRVYAHCVWLDEEDLRRFAKTGTSIAHCPSSNLKLGSGIAPVPDMLRLGVNVALGCDGGPSNDSYDLIREMKLAALLHKGGTLDSRAIRIMDVLRMATINGARALGKATEIGSLEAGKRGDFIVLDTRRPHLTPTLNPLSNLVYSAHGGDVRTVVIDGEVIVEDFRVKTMDETRILNEAQERAKALFERLGTKRKPS